MISCRTSELVYSVFEYPDCGEIKFSYHTCKSRFYLSCGNKYVRKRTETILQKCYNCKHRHIVFTISDFLWHFLEKIESFSIFYFKLFPKLYFLGLKININPKIIFKVLSLFSYLR